MQWMCVCVCLYVVAMSPQFTLAVRRLWQAMGQWMPMRPNIDLHQSHGHFARLTSVGCYSVVRHRLVTGASSSLARSVPAECRSICESAAAPTQQAPALCCYSSRSHGLYAAAAAPAAAKRRSCWCCMGSQAERFMTANQTQPQSSMFPQRRLVSLNCHA